MLARAAESVGLEWRPPPCPEPSRLDDWFLGVARAGSQGPTPVPFFPEVHDELTGTWTAPFTARNRSSGSSSLATLDGGAARGYTEVPPVERSVAMELCPRTASTWRGNPLLPSRACRHSSALTGSAYAACGEAASALHAMALLQVHQAKALRDLHEGGHDPGVLSELRTATDLALQATKVTARSLGRAMSTMVVQERHLCLCLADMKEVDKARFLNAPVSQTGLFGDAVENFAQQFSAAQKQTEAIRHILPRRAAAASTRPQCLGLLVAEGGPLPPPPLPRSRRSSLQPSSAVEPATGQPPHPSRPPSNQAASVEASGPETDDPGMEMFALREMVNAPLPPPEEGRAENLLFPFLPLASRSVVPKTSTKEQFPLSLGPQRGRGVVNESNLSYTHPPLSPVGSCGRFERAVNRTTHAPSAGTQVSASHTPTLLRTGNETPEPGPCVPPRCPTAGTSVGSLVSLVRFWGAWLALPNPSRWLLRTIRLGYAIQFARRPPKYRGIHSTAVRAAEAPILRAEISVLLAKDAIEPVPPADMRSGFYSPYFIVPKKSGGLRPILDLRVLNRALHRLPFKMLTPKRIFGCVRPQDWFAAIDLKDAYFHVSILPRHRPFLRFAFEGRAYQYKVLPFGLSLSPRVFTKVAEAALVPLREQGVRILNYLNDWLILAQSQDQLCEHRDMVLSHLSQLGLQVNWEKSKLSPVQRISFLGMELDSVSQTARLTQERAQSVLNCLNTFKNRTAAPLKQFQRLLGHMAAAAAVTPLGLLHMRSLQHWLHGRVPRWAWQSGTLRVQVTPACRQTFTPWSDLSFLRAGVPLEQVSRHAVVYTDASAKGWGATFNGHAVSGVWTGPQLHWHINCLELLAVHLALNRLKRRLRGEHVLVRTDNTATVAYINRQGGLCSRRMSQLARHLLLWSRKHLRSLRAIHIPGLLNRTADELSRAALPGEWRLHPGPADLATFWTRTGRPVRVPRDVALPVVLLPDRWNTRHGRTGTQLAAGPSQICISPSEPSRTGSVQGQRGRGADPARGTILAYQDLVPRADAPRDSPSLADSSEEGSTDSETGHLMAPASRPLETSCLVPRRDAEVLGDLPQEVVDTITSARAPSTRHAYALKWNLFVEWCSSHREDPRRCPIRVVLSFLQQGLERRLSPSTLKVYVAAIAANHDPVEGKSVGKHDWVVRFLRGARRLNPPRPPSIPSWDLSLVLRALQQGPFEPLQTVESKFLSMKTLLLLALASIKRVGDLHAFSVDDSCLQFGPADSQIILRPRPGYVPKVPTTPFRDQVVILQALPPEEADPALALLCPVRALRPYVDRTQSFRTSDQLFVCHGGRQKGNAVSKQRMAHWIVDAVTLAYQAQGVPCPFRLRAHSTRRGSWRLTDRYL